MPRSNVPSCSHASSHLWPRVAVLALIGASAAGCSDSARFDSNPYASNARQAPPQQEVTGSVASRPPTGGQVYAQPLPAPSRPATVAAGGGVANGAQGLGAYRPGTQQADITGSVAARPAPPKPAGYWTWDGGSPVTVGSGESIESIAHKHGVPVAALLQTNGFTSTSAIRPGQRLVIPRYVSGSAPQAAAPVPARSATPSEIVHVAARGESLVSVARHYGVTLPALAKANNIQPNGKIATGDRLVIPTGGRPLTAQQTPASAPQIAQPRTVPVEKKVASTTENARMVTPVPATTDTVAKNAEPTGAMPSFRWPVRGRVIAGFGASTNGTQNDGINLAVPAGTPIKAADDGIVAYAGNELKGYGNLVLIRHSNGFVSAYAHASELLVKRGDTIKRGQVIANAGQTGNVSSPQLHFEIRKGSTPVDPIKYLGGA
jgi:murein DD-endopeptidase MepM/ murein hydrolase activator NlpD